MTHQRQCSLFEIENIFTYLTFSSFISSLYVVGILHKQLCGIYSSHIYRKIIPKPDMYLLKASVGHVMQFCSLFQKVDNFSLTDKISQIFFFKRNKKLKMYFLEEAAKYEQASFRHDKVYFITVPLTFSQQHTVALTAL